MRIHKQLSWPLNEFKVDLQLPSAADMQSLCSLSVTLFSPYCKTLRNYTTLLNPTKMDYLSQAMAALGSALTDSSHQVSLWNHAHRSLTAAFATDNRKLREFRAHLSVRNSLAQD